MAVKTIDPNKPDISMTEKASIYLRQQVQSRQSVGLRFSVKESGCNGYKYVLDFIDKPDCEDCLVDIDDELKLYVTKEAIPYVTGTQIDYIIEGLNRTITFNNPNAAEECGCGESFSV